VSADQVTRRSLCAIAHEMFEDVDDIVIPGFFGAELRAENFLARLPEPRIQYPPIPDITVHQYAYGSQPKVRPSPLDVGRRIVEMATAVSGWRTMHPPDFKRMFLGHTFGTSPNAKHSTQ
jgi:hypothetical protein